MAELSSLFYGLKRSALLFLTSLLLLSLGIIPTSSGVFGISLSAAVAGTFLWLVFFAALFFSISFFWTAFIDARRLLPKHNSEMEKTEEQLQSVAQQLSVSAQMLPLDKDALLSRSDIENALSKQSDARELLALWKKRAGWSETEFSVSFDLPSDFDARINKAFQYAMRNFSRDGSTVLSPKPIIQSLSEESRRIFSKQLESDMVISIQKEILSQANETVATFSELTSTVAAKIDKTSDAFQHYSNRIEPIIDQMSTMVRQLNKNVVYIATTRTALNARFWILDVGAVATLCVVSIAHFIGLWWPVLPSLLMLLPTPHSYGLL